MVERRQGGDEQILAMKTVTWMKDSHSLFDYEFNKNVMQAMFQFSLAPKFVFIYRNNPNHDINVIQSDCWIHTPKEGSQLLGCFQIIQQNKKTKLVFYNATQIRQKMSEAGIRTLLIEKEEEIYLIVRSLKNKNNQNKGYKLNIGQIIKLGRVQYRVTATSQTCEQVKPDIRSSKFWSNDKRYMVEPLSPDVQDHQCKYCMLGESTEEGQFLCSPCKCSGSCGLVHFKCLQKWNQSKVKKQIIGGTIQYNFEKFFCEVCKEEYPRFIEKEGVTYELLPIEKPEGNHMMLEGITDKSNNMMIIQNVPADGIKLGRGHQCEIRITDISVSRNHAKIDKNGNDYYIFDNKSKFGTLIKQEKLSLEISRIKQGIQIGRTVITFQKSKKTNKQSNDA